MESISDETDGSRSPKVVVVGAGYAGVAAVGVLRAGGITDVTVLEAQGRPGGRVQTLQLEDGHLEIGAQFLHGQNEIYAIAERDNNLLDDEEDTEILPDTVLQYHEYVFYTPGGHLIDNHVILENLRALEDLQTKVSTALADGVADDVSVSVGDFLRARYADVMATTPGDEMLKNALLSWYKNWTKMDASGAVDDISLAGNGKYAYIPGSGVQETKTGMEDVFKSVLRESLPPGNLLLNKPVKKIHWTEKSSDSTELCPNVEDNLSENVRGQLCLSGELFSGERMPAGLTTPSSENGDAAVTGLSIRKEGAESSDEASVNSSDEQATMATAENGRNFRDRTEGVEKTPPEHIVLEISDDKRTNKTKSLKKAEDGYRVKVECEDGEVFHADHVIVTSSIGFLKEHQDFFQPQLPSVHRRAVNSMGFGNVAKVFLIWDQDNGAQNCLPGMNDAMAEWQEQVLGADVWGAVFLWPDGYKPQLKSAKTQITTSIGRQWFEDISLWELPSSLDMCICAWVGGEAATVMEQVPEQEVKDVLHEMLVLFLNKPSIPPPSRVIRSTWQSNKYVRGAYSYLSTGAPLELHDTLSQPVPSHEDPVLQLAGEACSKHYYSTAHGALDSGSLAARAILRHYSKLHDE